MTGKFSSLIKVQQVSRWEFKLLEELSFDDEILGRLTIEAGFVSDLASIRILRALAFWCALGAVVAAWLAAWVPWASNLLTAMAMAFLALYALTAGYGMRAAFLHDWLYTNALYPRADCDAVYRRALQSGDGTARWRSAIFWAGVRVGGAPHYGVI